jgi:hypothetical protein
MPETLNFGALAKTTPSFVETSLNSILSIAHFDIYDENKRRPSDF